MTDQPWHRHYDWDVPFSIRYPQISVGDLLQRPVANFPDKPALNFYGSTLTFWELRVEVLRLANALGALGVKQGDRVGLHLPNCPQYPIAFYACMLLGAIVVNLNPIYTPDELKGVCGQTGVSTLFTFGLVLPNIKALCQDVEIDRVIVTQVTDYIEGMPTSTAAELGLEDGWHHFASLMENSPGAKMPRIAIDPQDPAVIQFTGGTTGIPKGAVLTHANLVAASLQVSLWGGSATNIVPPAERSVMAVLPYFHVYGLIVVLCWAVYNCATQIQVPRFELEEFMGILAGQKRLTFFPAVPTLIGAVINHPRAEELELGRRVGLINSGGAPMPVEMIERVQDMGLTYSEGWGMSETTALGISNPISGLSKVGSIGLPWPDTEVRLVDLADGREDVPPGEPGEILIKSPLVMKEYWDNPQETAGQLRDGWLSSGDIAVMDGDGYFSIVDRKKDMVIAGGYNIYPREIDEVLYQCPKVQDACAVGVPDEYRGETIKAFIVLKPGQEATEEEIIAFSREKLAAYKAPKIVEFRDELPKSAVGKILRKVLRDEEAAKNRD